MTRRKVPSIDLDDYGFDLVGDDWSSTAAERVMLIGLDSLARDLYYTCLRPFASAKTGDVREASYYRFIQLLTPRQSPNGGPRFPVPTKKQLRSALQRLEAFGVVKLFLASSMRDGALQIRVVRRFGVVSSDSVRAGVRAGSKSAATRANARLKAELHTG